MREEFINFLEDNVLSAADVARAVGKSSSAVSQWKNGTYKGDNETLEELIGKFMRNYKKSKVETAAEEIVKTADLETAHFIIDEAVVAGEMALLTGMPGTGKTTAIKKYLEEHPEALLIEVVPGMRIGSFLMEICEQLGIAPSPNIDGNIKTIARELKRSRKTLIIDEGENLPIKALESVRRIWDFSQAPTILVGTHLLLRSLKGSGGELLQLYSRINGKWEFKGLTKEDREALFGEFADDVINITSQLRRATAIYRKAMRFADLRDEVMSLKHIKSASTMVILD